MLRPSTKNFIYLSFGALLCGVAGAEGWADLYGVSESGNNILIGPYQPRDDEIVWKDGIGLPIESTHDKYDISVYRETSSAGVVTYERQACTYDYSGQSGHYFSCSIQGESPLAGVRYKIIPNEDPNDCDYAQRYICIENCEDPDVPRVMYKEYWECYGEGD